MRYPRRCMALTAGSVWRQEAIQTYYLGVVSGQSWVEHALAHVAHQPAGSEVVGGATNRDSNPACIVGGKEIPGHLRPYPPLRAGGCERQIPSEGCAASRAIE